MNYLQRGLFACVSARRSQALRKFNISAANTQPQCSCTELTIPTGLDIDYTSPLKGTVATYDRHVHVSTGKHDWNSKIELEDGLAADIKGVFGKRGLSKNLDYARNPNNIILTTNSSYNPSGSSGISRNNETASGDSSATSVPVQHSSAYIFPQNVYLASIPSLNPADFPSPITTSLIQNYLLPTSPPASAIAHDKSLPFEPRKVQETHILICTHNSRDSRCGVLGPVLKTLFTQYLASKGLLHPESHDVSIRGKVRVGGISHVGGHKYAGNVIVYQPPDEDKWTQGGRGIWYGRVGSKEDVKKIVDSTIMKGIIIDELFRGGIGIKDR